MSRTSVKMLNHYDVLSVTSLNGLNQTQLLNLWRDLSIEWNANTEYLEEEEVNYVH
jgi:hypothetical protein